GVDTNNDGILEFPQTCTRCHSRVNPDDAAVAQLPAASLELTDEVSDEDALQLRAFRHLLFTRNELELVNNAVQVRLVPNPLDPTGPTIQVPLNPPMISGNARGSGAFFNRFRTGGSHAGYLTTAE